MSIRTNHACCSDRRFDIKMLVSVKQKHWLRPSQVVVEADEPCVNLVVTVMHKARRIMRYKNVDAWESSQRSLNFKLLEKKISSRLVFPRAAEPALADRWNRPFLSLSSVFRIGAGMY